MGPEDKPPVDGPLIQPKSVQGVIDRETTVQALKTYYEACLREIRSEGFHPHSYGLTDYAIAIVVEDVMRRCTMAQIEWIPILQDFVNRTATYLHRAMDGGSDECQVHMPIEDDEDDGEMEDEHSG